MAFTIQPGFGVNFEVAGFRCVFAAQEPPIGIGQQVLFGVGPEGGEEYDVAAVVWGPGDLSAAIVAAGGIGNFIVTVLWPVANQILPHILSKHPLFVKIDNASPPTMDNLNMALAEYTKVDPTPDGNSVQFSFKPYP